MTRTCGSAGVDCVCESGWEWCGGTCDCGEPVDYLLWTTDVGGGDSEAEAEGDWADCEYSGIVVLGSVDLALE